jgi:hypothetical protein
MSSEQTKRDASGAGSDPASGRPSALGLLLMRRPYLPARVGKDDGFPATDGPACRGGPENKGTKLGTPSLSQQNDAPPKVSAGKAKEEGADHGG